ncbi:Development/cell death domain [Macleaya cordata]|uniref:Development/cell death domain n=1 Tax=Macleaya cordata TaxID=56857 RepID=A0A200QW87_MACCD|nr:Development/cell death domain [Macleaya cordata]
MENNQQTSFWQFSDQLRVQSSTFANLSINDTIWGNSFTAKKPEERRNFDIRVGGDRTSSSSSITTVTNTNTSSNNNINSNSNGKQNGSDYLNGFNDGWKIASGFGGLGGGSLAQKNFNVNINGGFNKGVYSKFENNKISKINNNNNIINNNNKKNEEIYEGKVGKKSNNNNNNNNNNTNSKSSGDNKRFKTLPPSESLPRNETVGGYIFVCNNDTMQENLRRQLFGLPPRYRDSVRAITPGLPLFLYNYSTHQLHGIFEASSFGGTNIDPTAWEDKKCAGESRFPAQVRVLLRKLCEPLEEDSFRPVLHHYDGPKFRLELNIPEALALLDIFAEQNP